MQKSYSHSAKAALRISIAGAFLAAISIVLGKYLAIPGGNVLRFSFENMPIMLAGVAFGPLCGALVGVVADLIGCVLVGYEINPLVTLGAALIGGGSGLIYRAASKVKKMPLGLSLGISVAAAHIVGSVIVKTFGLAAFYSFPVPILMLWRLLNYIIVGLLEWAVLWYMLKSKALTGAIDKLLGKEREAKSGMTYEDALSFIHGINWEFCKPGLQRTEELCEKLGHPEKELKFIHVVGTNGKGSTSSMLASVLQKAGYKVGLYTSPYIVEFGERMRVNGENIPKEILANICEYIKPIADGMTEKPTEFELITAIAFEYFRREAVDIVVLEAGLGGRLDSTNVIRFPVLDIVTGISLEHTAILGDTIEKIAREKAGIIKDGAPVIYGGESSEARDVISEIAAERGSHFTSVAHEAAEIISADMSGTVFNYRDFHDVKISLLGSYQVKNACLVLEAVSALRNSGYNISDEALEAGLANAKWQARFEIISNTPLVIYDGAHNPEGIQNAVKSIKMYFGEQKVYILGGILRDKDYNSVAEMLSGVASRAFTITPDNPRALSAEEYRDALLSFGVDAVAYSEISSAVADAVTLAKDMSVPLICLGSLYTYASVREAVVKETEKYKKEIYKEEV